MLLQEEPKGLSVNEISEALTIAPSTVTRFVDKLAAKGYVERIKIGKHSYTKITDEGQKIMPEVYKAWHSIFDKIETLVGDQKYLEETKEKFIEFTNIIENGKK